jgi:hypothetical protein
VRIVLGCDDDGWELAGGAKGEAGRKKTSRKKTKIEKERKGRIRIRDEDDCGKKISYLTLRDVRIPSKKSCFIQFHAFDGRGEEREY